MNRTCSIQEGSSSSIPHLSIILTVRLLMQGKEVGSIIGKRGDHIKLIRDQSGAKINISDGSCPERIVTITGNTETINRAFVMICAKLQQDLQALSNTIPKPPITMRLIVPATQCGCIIGKGGSKIKEIREATGASVQVASEMLPSSTERAVTISGSSQSIVLCMQNICQILLEAPAKGNTLPYRPKPTFNPALLASSAAAAASLLQQQHHQPQQHYHPTLINPLDVSQV
ncbi:unnamed protein product [Thelazia callipaeda]|uniref:Poly(RC)-binding protein 3 n=1 Tax=Thelazia callipaeda TaxID=103827 RepID=A0A158RCJ1_THECL|nr:unnamed protein product [Thelazia callipaeda]